MEVDDCDSGHCVVKIPVREQSSARVFLVHSQDVLHHGVEDVLCGVGHEDWPGEVHIGNHPRQSSAVVQVEVRDENHVDIRQAEVLEQR